MGKVLKDNVEEPLDFLFHIVYNVHLTKHILFLSWRNKCLLTFFGLRSIDHQKSLTLFCRQISRKHFKTS